MILTKHDNDHVILITTVKDISMIRKITISIDMYYTIICLSKKVSIIMTKLRGRFRKEVFLRPTCLSLRLAAGQARRAKQSIARGKG